MDGAPYSAGYLITAYSQGVSFADGTERLLAFGSKFGEGQGNRRQAVEVKPTSVDCSLPRLNANSKSVRVVGTARVLIARFNAPSVQSVGQSVVAAVEIRANSPPPDDWTEQLHSRGTLYVSSIPDDLNVLARFLLDDGLQEPSDLNLGGIAASRQSINGSSQRSHVRLVWHGHSVGVALLADSDVEASRDLSLSQPDLLTAMSIVADLGFVRWLINETNNIIGRLLRGRIEPDRAIQKYLELDELFETHRLSGHTTATRSLLQAFDTEYQWSRLGNRITMASLASLLDHRTQGVVSSGTESRKKDSSTVPIVTN